MSLLFAEKDINRSSFDEMMVVQKRSGFRAFFREELTDINFRVSVKINGVITNFTKNSLAIDYAWVENGELYIKAPPNVGDITYVHTREHPQFHPNNGKRLSTSCFFDTYPAGDHEVGFINPDETDLRLSDAITLRFNAGQISGRIFSNFVEKTWPDGSAVVPPQKIAGLGWTPNKGHLIDIQAQLRDVGNIYYFVSGKTSEKPKEILRYNGLNNQNNVTVSNAAMHGGYIVRNNGTRSQMRVGCIDISNETQDEELQAPVTLSNSSEVTCTTGSTVMLLCYLPFSYLGKLNTRDCQYYSASVFSDKRSRFKIYRAPDISLFTKTGGIPLAISDFTQVPGSSIMYIDNSIDLPLQPGIRVTGFNKTGLLPFDGIGFAGSGQENLLFPAPDRIPLKFVHGELIVYEGTGRTASASMSIDSTLIGESI